MGIRKDFSRLALKGKALFKSDEAPTTSPSSPITATTTITTHTVAASSSEDPESITNPVCRTDILSSNSYSEWEALRQHRYSHTREKDTAESEAAREALKAEGIIVRDFQAEVDAVEPEKKEKMKKAVEEGEKEEEEKESADAKKARDGE